MSEENQEPSIKDRTISYASGTLGAIVCGVLLGLATKAGYTSVIGAGGSGGLVVGGLMAGLCSEKFKMAWDSFGKGIAIGVIGACALVGIARAENVGTTAATVQQGSLWQPRATPCPPAKLCSNIILPRLNLGS